MNMLNQQVARSSEEQARSAKEVLKAIQNISKMSGMVNDRQAAQIASTKEAGVAVEYVDKNALSQSKAADKLNNIIVTINDQLKELLVFTEEFKI